MRLFLSYYNHGIKQEANLKRENIQNSVKNITRIQENSKKKKRKKRGNVSEGELKQGQPITRSRRRPAIDLPKEASKKRRMADSEQNLPKGKKGLSHHLFKRISWKKNRKRPFKFWQHQRPLKAQLLKSLHQKISFET